MTKTWEVKLPIAGHAILEVEADTEELAIAAAMEKVTTKDIETWDALMRFNEGNFCYCPQLWEAEATAVDWEGDDT